MPFDKEELEKTARLCRFALTKEEQDALLPELEEMLALTACLKDEEGEKVAIDLQQMPFVTRKDETEDFLETDRLLACAPMKKDGFFLVSLKKEGQS